MGLYNHILKNYLLKQKGLHQTHANHFQFLFFVKFIVMFYIIHLEILTKTSVADLKLQLREYKIQLQNPLSLFYQSRLVFLDFLSAVVETISISKKPWYIFGSGLVFVPMTFHHQK